MRGLVPTLHHMFEQYNKSVDFLCIYILEAHAKDEWPISSSRYNPTGKPVSYFQPTTNEERISIAQDFVSAYNFRLPVVIDCIENEFERQYSSWPIRFFIFQNKKIKYIAQPKNCTYYPQAISEWLEKNL